MYGLDGRRGRSYLGRRGDADRSRRGRGSPLSAALRGPSPTDRQDPRPCEVHGRPSVGVPLSPRPPRRPDRSTRRLSGVNRRFRDGDPVRAGAIKELTRVGVPEVSMNDAAAVLERLGKLSADAAHAVRGPPARRNHRAERPTSIISMASEAQAPFGDDLVHSADVRMIECGDRSRIAHQPVVVGRHVEPLHGHIASQPHVVGAIHHPHCHRVTDLVEAEARARTRRGFDPDAVTQHGEKWPRVPMRTSPGPSAALEQTPNSSTVTSSAVPTSDRHARGWSAATSPFRRCPAPLTPQSS